jgi:hypothetical protein
MLTAYEGATVPQIFEYVPVPAFMALLGEANRGHDNQSHYDASGYDVLCHGCHSRKTARPRLR